MQIDNNLQEPGGTHIDWSLTVKLRQATYLLL